MGGGPCGWSKHSGDMEERCAGEGRMERSRMRCMEMMESDKHMMGKMHCCNKMEGKDSLMQGKNMECDEEVGFTHKCHSNEIKK